VNRCSVPNGTLGTGYPKNIEQCMRKVSGMEVGDIMTAYGFSAELPAKILHQRSTDMLTQGFEWSMENSWPINSPRYKLPHQRPCCGLSMSRHMLVCDKCWQPLLPEDFTNSTDLSLVTSLVRRTRGGAETPVSGGRQRQGRGRGRGRTAVTDLS
jgi:hypothetical protein